jgi:chromosome segregation ATPase
MTIKTSSELKALKTRLTEAEVDLSIKLEASRDANREAERARTKVATVKAQLTALESAAKAKDVIVTEHAILRYIERVYGIDLEEIRERMLAGGVRETIENFGSGKIPCEGGRLIVKDRVVMTVEAA